MDLKSASTKDFASIAVASGMFKDLKDVTSALMKISLGRSLGIDEATALNSIVIVNGRLTFTANLIAARINQSGKYRYEITKKDDKACHIQFYVKLEDYTPEGKQIFKWTKAGIEEKFTWDMAKRAELTTKDSWKKYPEPMLFSRCLTAGARCYCPEVLLGNPAYTPDELDPNLSVVLTEGGEIIVDAEVVDSTVKADPVIVNKQVDEIVELLQATATDATTFLSTYKVGKFDELTSKQREDISRLLKKKLTALPKTP